MILVCFTMKCLCAGLVAGRDWSYLRCGLARVWRETRVWSTHLPTDQYRVTAAVQTGCAVLWPGS